jgi:hypothetical protein
MIRATRSTSSSERARELLQGLGAPLNELLAHCRLAEAEASGEAGGNPLVVALRKPKQDGLLHLLGHRRKLLHLVVAFRRAGFLGLGVDHTGHPLMTS